MNTNSSNQLVIKIEVEAKFRKMNFRQASVVSADKRHALTCCDGMSFASTPYTIALQA